MYRFLLFPFRAVGSMFFAISIILILVAVMAWATFLGMRFGDDASAWAVYHAGWFLTLCVLLGLSVLFSALLRFPWKKYQTGFLVTHLGILVLMLGCLLDFRYGQSAYISIPEGGVNSVATCPGDVHFELKITDAQQNVTRKILPFSPGPFSWRFYGEKSFMGYGVGDDLPIFPWNFIARNRAGNLLYNANGCKLEVLDYLQSGTIANASANADTDATTPKTTPVGVEDFRWEVIKAGGNPGELKNSETKMSIKQHMNGWKSWVKVRFTLDGVAEDFWLQQFDYFKTDGMKIDTPKEENCTVFRLHAESGREVQLVYAQNTIDLNFALKLERFNNRLDPGTSMASHYSSDVRIIEKNGTQKEEKTAENPKIPDVLSVSMNQPLDIYELGTGQVWRLFQTSFSGPFLNETETFLDNDQFYISTLTVSYSPGRGFLYLGCLLVVLGIGIMFSMKAYFFQSSSKDSSPLTL